MTNQDDITIKTEINELKVLFAAALNRMSQTEVALERLARLTAARKRAIIWQIIIFALVMTGTAFCAMYVLTLRLSH